MDVTPEDAERAIGEGATIAIYFGAGDGGDLPPGVEFVHAQAIHLTCPEFLQRVTKWGIISLPHAPQDVRNAIVRFFYTGRVPFHEVHKFTLRRDVEEAFDLAIHVYSHAVYSEITKMKDQATEYMKSLFPYMEPFLMLAYTYSVLDPLYPDLNYEWVEAQAALWSPNDGNDKLMEALEAERQADLQSFNEFLNRRENAWVKINEDGEEESGEESEQETEIDEEVQGKTEAEETEAETELETEDGSYDSDGKLKVIGDDGLINLDLANYPPGVYRW